MRRRRVGSLARLRRARSRDRNYRLSSATASPDRRSSAFIGGLFFIAPIFRYFPARKALFRLRKISRNSTSKRCFRLADQSLAGKSGPSVPGDPIFAHRCHTRESSDVAHSSWIDRRRAGMPPDRNTIPSPDSPTGSPHGLQIHNVQHRAANAAGVSV